MSNKADNPVVDTTVLGVQVTFITLTWKDGQRRTIGTGVAADVFSLGILVKGGITPEEVDQRFGDKVCREPRGQPDILKVAMDRSGN